MATKKAKYGSVKVVDRNGKLYLDFRYLSDRYRPALNLVANDQNKKAAQLIASKIELDIATNQFDTTLIVYLGSKEDKVKPRDTKRSDLSSLFRFYWDMKGLSGNDYESVRRFIYRGNPNWGNLEATVKAQGWNATTHNRYCKILNQFLQWAISEEKVKTNLLSMLKTDRRKDATRKPFTDDEIKLILEAFNSNQFCPVKSAYKHSDYLPMLKFLFLTGCRLGEVVGLKVKHFNFNDSTVEIAESLSPKSAYDSSRIQKSTKTGSVRVLPLPKSFLEDFLEVTKDKKPEDYVFTGSKGKAINQKNFTQRIWKTVLEGLGIPYRVPYAARHTMASRAIEQGIPLTGVAYLMGHSDTTMVSRRYAHMINKPSLPLLRIAA